MEKTMGRSSRARPEDGGSVSTRNLFSQIPQELSIQEHTKQLFPKN